MKKNYLFLVGIGALLAMSSCSKEEDLTVVKKDAPATLVLTLKGTKTNTRVQSTAVPTDENTVNNVVVGLFKADGKTDVIQYGELDDNDMISVKGTPGIRTIVVVANSNESANYFAGITTLDDFRDKILKLPPSQSSNKLPMSGELSNKELLANQTVTEEVHISRLVARVQLGSLTTNFDENGQYANATFVADAIFMYNAQGSSTVNGLTSANNLLQGWDATKTPPTYPTYDANLRNVLSPTVSFPTGPYTPYNYFYTFANAIPGDLNLATRLVIGGTFTANGTSSYVYYPVIVNRAIYPDVPDNTTRKGLGIERNYIYSINVVIKSKGGDTPITVIDPAYLDLTVKVDPWTLTITQPVEF